MKQLLDNILEATTTDLQRKQKSITKLFPTFPDRVKAVADKGGVRLVDTKNEVWHFRIHSGTQETVWYDVYIRFKDIIPTLVEIIKDRRLWVVDGSRIDRKKLARKFLDIVDVELLCNCPAQQFWGPNYQLTKRDAKYTKPEIRRPKIRNPKEYGMYCKHTENLMRVLPFYTDTVMRWLEDFHGKSIKGIEAETQKKLGFFKKAARALKGIIYRKPEEPVEVEKEETKESKLNERGLKGRRVIVCSNENDPLMIGTVVDYMKSGTNLIPLVKSELDDKVYMCLGIVVECSDDLLNKLKKCLQRNNGIF